LKRQGQSHQLAAGHQRDVPPHRQGVRTGPSSHPVAQAPLDGPAQRRVPPVGQADPEAPCGLVEIELESFRFDVQAVGQPTEQPRCRRAEHPEPEGLDIQRARVDAEGIDLRVAPRHDAERR
jgi:hypothetical protein